jgi:hypothetical protein
VVERSTTTTSSSSTQHSNKRSGSIGLVTADATGTAAIAAAAVLPKLRSTTERDGS